MKMDLKTKIGSFIISTVELPFDLNMGVGEPAKYETMIFKKDDGENVFEDYQERYSTRMKALKGHIRAIAMVRKEVLKK